MKKEQKLKKKKKRKSSKSSSSSSSDGTLTDTDKKDIKIDIKELKKVLKLIKRKAYDIPNGIKGWCEHFDTD
jgi:hypothetical protein